MAGFFVLSVLAQSQGVAPPLADPGTAPCRNPRGWKGWFSAATSAPAVLCTSTIFPPTYVAMEEGLIPYSGASQTYLTLQRVKGRHLQHAIQALLKVSQLRDEELLFAFSQD